MSYMLHGNGKLFESQHFKEIFWDNFFKVVVTSEDGWHTASLGCNQAS